MLVPLCTQVNSLGPSESPGDEGGKKGQLLSSPSLQPPPRSHCPALAFLLGASPVSGRPVRGGQASWGVPTACVLSELSPHLFSILSTTEPTTPLKAKEATKKKKKQFGKKSK